MMVATGVSDFCCSDLCLSAKRRAVRRRGLTLMEVMLAIAILGGAMAVMGELVRIGARSAAEARDLATAQLLCETKMAEITLGIVPPEVIAPTPVETLDADNQWLYSVETAAAEQEGLIVVQVTVQQDVDPQQQPISYSLTRWMIDPNLQLELQESSSEVTGSETSKSGSGNG
jgi:prepilin-type N-terminal cleavage/methylation domain-containing protein